MSSIDPNNRSPQGTWSKVVPYIAPVFGASTAIVPVFYGFIAKTKRQLGEPVPRLTAQVLKESLVEGVKAAPIIGLVVGLQIGAQQLFEEGIKKLKEKYGYQKDQPASFSQMVFSSMAVGFVSVPLLAAFNGRTMKKGFMESIRDAMAKPKQAFAIISRETSFVFSLRVSSPITKYFEGKYGKNKAVEYGSSFFSGAVGSLIGHPADTALTLWQKGRKVEVSQLMKGGVTKALSVGWFCVFLKAAQQQFEKFTK